MSCFDLWAGPLWTASGMRRWFQEIVGRTRTAEFTPHACSRAASAYRQLEIKGCLRDFAPRGTAIGSLKKRRSSVQPETIHHSFLAARARMVFHVRPSVRETITPLSTSPRLLLQPYNITPFGDLPRNKKRLRTRDVSPDEALGLLTEQTSNRTSVGESTAQHFWKDGELPVLP